MKYELKDKNTKPNFDLFVLDIQNFKMWLFYNDEIELAKKTILIH